MATVRWIKIVTDVFDDEKILLIESMPDADAIIVIWFKLLCLAGKQNNSGVFMMGRMPYTEEMFATIFRRPINTVRMALRVFENFGMIEIINDAVTIPNWGKHQSIDQIEAKNAYMKEYMREYRAKQKSLSDGKSNCKTNGKANVSEADKNRIEKSRVEGEKNNPIGEQPRTARSIPPTIEEVRAYCAERRNGVDPEAWYDHYTSNGWMVGKTKMKDWKAAVRTWERNPINRVAPKQNGNIFFEMLQEEM